MFREDLLWCHMKPSEMVYFFPMLQNFDIIPYFPAHKTHTHTHTHTHTPIRHTVIFLLGISEKNNDECILILVIYWKKTGLLHTKISNHNIIYSS